MSKSSKKKKKSSIFQSFMNAFVEKVDESDVEIFDDEEMQYNDTYEGIDESANTINLFSNDSSDIEGQNAYNTTRLNEDDSQSFNGGIFLFDGDENQFDENIPIQSSTSQPDTCLSTIPIRDNDEDQHVSSYSDQTSNPEYDAAGTRPENPEEINLFDDETSGEQNFTGRTRIFKTGKKTQALHVNINETKQYKSVEAAEKKNRELDAEIQHEKVLKKKTRKKKVRNFFKRFSLNLIFGLFIFVCMVAAVYFTFLLSDIIVTGNQQYSANYIVEQSGLEIGQHMFFVDLDEAKANIESNPYLQVNSITYIFPSRVRIDIDERKEVAGLVGLDYNVIIDKNGYVLSMSGGTDLTGLLQVSGISMTGFQLGQRIGESSDFATATLISIINKLEEYELVNYIQSLDLTTPLAITMYTATGFKIFIGQPTDLDKKFSSLKKLLPKFTSSGVATGTLYLSAKGGTVYSPPSLLFNSTPEITGEITQPDTEGNVEEGTDVITTPEIYTTPEPTITPVPIQPGGGDDFQG